MFNWLLKQIGIGAAMLPAAMPHRAPPMNPAIAAATQRLMAAFDNARWNDDNRRNWFGADFLSAKSSNSGQVRQQLRIRSRHEVSNNPFLFGVANGNADDLISTGPTLQIRTPSAKYNRKLERLWNGWWIEVRGVEKLRTCKLAKTVDGEGFLVLRTVPDLDSEIKLYPCDLEADQVTTPTPTNVAEMLVDGLTLHPITQQPTFYHVLKYHPGDYWFPSANPLAVDNFPAAYVIHWFQKFRPGQVRGIPTFASSLDLFAELRAFRKAVLAAAQIAANLTAMLESSAPGASDDEDDDEEDQSFRRVPIDRGMMTQLPAGMTAKPFDPKQPATTYEMFAEKCLGEAIRPLGYPLNLALGTSQKFNFSSAKLDHINYRSGLTVERVDCNRTVLHRLFSAFFTEAVLCGAIEPFDGMNLPPHEWHWPGFEPLDAVADATADHERRSHGTLTDREFWARRGHDWKDVYAQLHEEAEERERLHLEFGEPIQRSETESTSDEDAEAANVA